MSVVVALPFQVSQLSERGILTCFLNTLSSFKSEHMIFKQFNQYLTSTVHSLAKCVLTEFELQ